MTKDPDNIVKLNLPAGMGQEPPHPGEPPVTVNGVSLGDIKSVLIEADVDRTLVTISFYAHVYGDVAVSEERLYNKAIILNHIPSSRK